MSRTETFSFCCFIIQIFFLLQSLKSLSLIRLGKLEEGITLADQVRSQKPSDDSTLQVLTIGYKEVNKSELFQYFHYCINS